MTTIIITGVLLLSESDRCDLRLEPRLEHSGGENFGAAGAAASCQAFARQQGGAVCEGGDCVEREGEPPTGRGTFIFARRLCFLLKNS